MRLSSSFGVPEDCPVNSSLVMDRGVGVKEEMNFMSGERQELRNVMQLAGE